MNRIEELRSLVPAEIIVTDPDMMEGYRSDKADLVAAGKPLAVLRPRCTAHVATIMKWATKTGTVVVPRGAGTGLSGGATALDGGVIVTMERMNSIRRLDPTNHTVEVEAGLVNAEVSRAVADSGLFYPPDPGSFEVSTIGGNLATNAGGMRCVKYGVTRNSVLGLEIVLADGRILRTGGQTIKNVAGLDLTHLFVGSEGTLGIITAATLRLRPTPVATATFAATFPTLESGGRALDSIFACGVTPSVLELMDNVTINAVEDYQRMDLDREAALLLIGQADGTDALAQVERMVSCCDDAGAALSVATADPAESELLLQARRLAGWATTEQYPTIIEDVGVPRSRLPELLSTIAAISEDTGVRIATVGHAGDGNLHPMLLLPDLDDDTRQRAMQTADHVCAAALALDGTITGEHGIGELKRHWLPYQLDNTALQVQASIKHALDPANLLNPGRGF
ncbi:FAD-binding protein [Rhodococcus opacus]|uniref:FAD-binding protein n=1 Tax=Rhodococcus opacus TaxID=37919 RepID=A0AAX3YPY2_RHOOP|nr:FAD-linked oxidase C-terminal domain-containing protein [Rhodococcus opacus]MCZ4587623.1 FAD-binding protein [Rhodococcus opacus]WLF51381.1 FAD-linked oxidase C-terminal domain-containing protein [Rhodococcus opacus]